jgi:hypothetical protein
MEELYLVKKSTLIDLIAGYYKLVALENSGVDNWDWYEESLQSWIEAVREDPSCQLSTNDAEEVFETVAEADLNRFGKPFSSNEVLKQ